jgi:hypothetical protein
MFFLILIIVSLSFLYVNGFYPNQSYIEWYDIEFGQNIDYSINSLIEHKGLKNIFVLSVFKNAQLKAKQYKDEKLMKVHFELHDYLEYRIKIIANLLSF